MADINNNVKTNLRKKFTGVKQLLSFKNRGKNETNGLRTSSVPVGLDRTGLGTPENLQTLKKSDEKQRKLERRQSSIEHRELERIASKYRRPKKISISSIDENTTLETDPSRTNKLSLSSQKWRSFDRPFDRPRSLILDPEKEEMDGLGKSLLDMLNNFNRNMYGGITAERNPDRDSLASHGSFNSIAESFNGNELSDLESCSSSIFEHDISSPLLAEKPIINGSTSPNTKFTQKRDDLRQSVYKNRSFNREKKSLRRSTSYAEDDGSNGIKKILTNDSIKDIIEKEATKIICDKEYDAMATRRWSKDICCSVRDQIRLCTGSKYKIVVNAFIGSVQWSDTDSTHVAIRNTIDPEKDFFVVAVFENNKVFISVSVLILKR